MLSAVAPAKINLALHITGRRADGFHELSSLVCFTDIGDTVHVEHSDSMSLEIGGSFAASITGAPTDNLIWQVAQMLRAEAGDHLLASIHLQKELPVAAGVGGGSSDAATTAILLNRLWNLNIPHSSLAERLLPLGSDIPACITKHAAFMEGIGEKMMPLDTIPAFYMVLVNPLITLETPSVFHHYAAQQTNYSAPLSHYPKYGGVTAWSTWLRETHNDLTDAACALCPDISVILQCLEGLDNVLFRGMSGSGATCFGIFADEGAATHAASQISDIQPSWWVRACQTLPAGAAKRI